MGANMVKNQRKYKEKNAIKILKTFLKVFRILINVDKIFIGFIIFITILQGLMPTILILLTQKLINTLQMKNSTFKELMLIVFAYLSLDLISTQISNIKNYYSSKFQMKFSLELNLKVLNKISELELKDFENSDIYNKIQRAQNESNSKIFTYFMYFIGMMQQTITLVSSALLLIAWKWWSIFLVITVPIITSLYMIKLGKIQFNVHRERTGKERQSWYFNYLMTNDIAFKEIKLYNLVAYFIKKYKNLNEGFIEQDTKIIKRRTKIQLILEVFDQLLIAVVFYSIVVSAFLKKILIGDTIAFIRCISIIKSNVQAVLSSIVLIFKDTLYIGQLFEFLDMELEKKHTEEIHNLESIESIEIKNLSYKYKSTGEYALRNINLIVEKNDIIALIGKNGSGKTTLIKLLSGFYDDYEGEIYINHINIKNIDKENLRKNIGIIFQDYIKYELTVRENVGLGNLKYFNDDRKIHESLEKSGADIFLEKMPNGLESQLGFWFENGMQLSGGEWQKTALSRAFMRDASLYILDEPSAALDPVSEFEILNKSYNLIKNNIGIIITHRISNIRRMANKIVVLDNGELVECGTHEELMINNCIYKDLYDKQNTKKFA